MHTDYDSFAKEYQASKPLSWRPHTEAYTLGMIHLSREAEAVRLLGLQYPVCDVLALDPDHRRPPETMRHYGFTKETVHI